MAIDVLITPGSGSIEIENAVDTRKVKIVAETITTSDKTLTLPNKDGTVATIQEVAAGYEPLITKGTISQYFRGDMSLATFPTTMTPSSHTHGNIANDGKIGSIADQVVVTGAAGALTTLSRSGIDSRASFPTTSSTHNHDDRYYTETEMQTGNIYMRNLLLNPTGVPSSNLGTPSVAEMALFQEQFNNKTEFHNINNIVFEEYNGTTWTDVTSTISIEHRKAFVGGDTNAVVNIPSGSVKYRITLRQTTSYVYLNALYMYYSTQGNNTKVHIWKKHDSGNWEQHTNSDTNVSSWPGHLFLPFSTIPWHYNPTLGNGYHEVRIEFIPTWSNANPIVLQKLQIWGGYPAGKRTIYSVNGDKEATFPAKVTAPQLSSTVGTGYAPFTVASTTLVSNLNADLLDGKHATDFYLATNPNSYISGITKAMIEAQLTGAITSHTHSYEAPISTGTTAQYWRGDKQ